MIKFFCAHCGKEFRFEKLPIPDAGAKFQCSDCQKTSNLLKRGETVFCYPDEDEAFSSRTSMVDMSDAYRSAVEDDLSSEELESRLQGMFVDLPYDVDLHIGVIDGPDQGTTFPIKKPVITIGKSHCDISLSDPLISTEHCQLEIFGNQMVVLRDLGSTSGTFRNNVPTSLSCLRPGDKILIGKTTLVLIQNPKKVAS